MVAGVCVFAFVLVSFAHTLHHFNAATSNVGFELSVGSDGNDPELPKKAGLSVEHCHGCAMIGIAIDECPGADFQAVAERFTLTLEGMRAHSPVAETPPPIA